MICTALIFVWINSPTRS